MQISSKLFNQQQLKQFSSTTEELQAELQNVVHRHNQAQEVVKQCQKRFTELTAIIKDRTTFDSEEAS